MGWQLQGPDRGRPVFCSDRPTVELCMLHLHWSMAPLLVLPHARTWDRSVSTHPAISLPPFVEEDPSASAVASVGT